MTFAAAYSHKQQFWRRYKMRFPPEIHPADTTISRVAREMQKRMLCVYNIWRVKTLQFQLTTSQKKRKLSEGLFIEDDEDEEVVAHDVDNYLDRLFTLLLAYAMAGCAGVTGAPDAAQELNLGADTVKFVNVPLDVIYIQVLLPCQAKCHWDAHFSKVALASDQGCGRAQCMNGCHDSASLQ